MNRRMDRSRLNIGVYFLQPYARTPRHVRELAECGVDFVVCMDDDRAALDLLAEHGVGAIVTGILPPWWGGDGDNAGQMARTNPLERYREAAERFTDHPAIWGIDTGDEPSALDFPHYGRVTELTERLFPNQFAYLNLYPNYASVARNDARQKVNQLGTATYPEHIDAYCANVGLDYLCYDFYMYSASVTGAYENLLTVSDACRRSGRSLWIVLQVNSNRPQHWITLNQLRFQANTALCFGAENITWGCYTAGWWHNQVLDEAGEKTCQYDRLQQVNRELHKLGQEYMRYRWCSAHFIGFAPGDLDGVSAQSAPALDTGVFGGVRLEGGSLLVGQMAARSGVGTALMVTNCDDPMDRAPSVKRVRFAAGDRQVRVYTGTGEIVPDRTEDGEYSFPLAASAGALITAQ